RGDGVAREGRRVEPLGEMAAAIGPGGAHGAGERARRARVEAAVAHDREPRHHGAYLRIGPARVVEGVKPEIAVEQRRRSEVVEAVVGGLARLRIEAAGGVLLALQRW